MFNFLFHGYQEKPIRLFVTSVGLKLLAVEFKQTVKLVKGVPRSKKEAD